MSKSIFITGGTSGIGLACAEAFLRKGYRVGIAGRNKLRLEELSDKFETYCADVRNLDEISLAIKLFSKNGLDIVLANAGVGYEHKSRIPDFNIARNMIDVNIKGTLNTFEAALEHFYLQGHGHLAATASIAGFNGLPGVCAYSGSKSAIIKICESLSIDLEAKNILVTCINPGFIDTPLTRKNTHSMPFLKKSDEMAQAVVKGIETQKKVVFFPKFFCLLVRVLSILPRPIYKRIITQKSFNYSKQT